MKLNIEYNLRIKNLNRDKNAYIICSCRQGRLHKKRQGGEMSQKGTKDTISMSYPWTDSRDDHWGCIFAILELTKVTNSGSLTISGRGGQEHVMQQYNG